jgi:hypothetical protein
VVWGYEDLLEGRVVEAGVVRQVMHIGNNVGDLSESVNPVGSELRHLFLEDEESVVRGFRVAVQVLDNIADLLFRKFNATADFIEFDLYISSVPSSSINWAG